MAFPESLIFIGFIFALSVAITPAIRLLAIRSGLMDHPSARSSHVVATPRAGGLAIFFTVMIAFLALWSLKLLATRDLIAVLIGGSSVAFIGFMDDRKSVPAKVRFAVHLGAAMVVVLMLGAPPISALFCNCATPRWIDQSIAVIAVAWSINLFNFMDGIDGIAAAEAAFVSLSGGLIVFSLGGNVGLVYAMLALGMAALGFLVWNWPPASIFLGDVGSGFLGFILASLSIIVSRHMTLPVEVWLILGGVFLGDASITLVRRILRRDRWYLAHRTHAYQHLARRWHGHAPVTLLVCAVNTCWLFPWAWYAATHPNAAAFSLAVSLAPIFLGAILAKAGLPEGEGMYLGSDNSNSQS